MDRLICGDVGYGKTEVALRAAFKAVQDGKQVMLLVPTTILAQQHYGTFTERLKDYPVTIEHVSRFRPAAEQREAVARFARGQGRHPDRDPPAAVARRPRQGPRAADRRRGAALRGQAEGAAAPAQAEGRRDRDERHADPAHAADVAGRRARHQRDRDPARGPAADQDLRRRVRRGAGQGRARCASTSAAARRSSCTTGSRRSTRRPSGCAALCPAMRFEVAHGQMDEQDARAADAARSCAATPTCSCARASSSRGSTSRRPTR